MDAALQRTLDTGFLFPETQVLWSTLEARYGVKVQVDTEALEIDRAGKRVRVPEGAKDAELDELVKDLLAAKKEGAKGFIGNATDATAHWFGVFESETISLA